MTRVRSHRPLAAAVLLAGVFALPSCGTDPSEPVPRPTVHRTVTAVVRDSLGAPVADAVVSWTAGFDSAGLIETRFDFSDVDGASMQVIAEGPWLVTADSPSGPVAGAGFQVSGPERAAVDTQLVALVLHTGSRVTGLATLAGRTDHHGILVSGEAGGLSVTDSTGAWSLDGVPLGRWTFTMFKLGFRLGIAQVTVTAPGSSLAAPAVQLVSDP
jgi:hypothetical protein